MCTRTSYIFSCCNVLQCVQFVAVWCSVSQCAAVCCRVLQIHVCHRVREHVTCLFLVHCQSLVTCFSVLQCVAERCKVMQCIAVCCSAL